MLQFSFLDTQKYKDWTKELKKVRVELGLDMGGEQKLILAFARDIADKSEKALQIRSSAIDTLTQFEKLIKK